MKSVMISIKPKWCELIANGKKTIEIRKTRPKIDTPFKCYIYCTKAKDYFSVGNSVYFCSDELYRLPTGEIKFGYSFELASNWAKQYDKNNFLNGKVIGEFVCDEIIGGYLISPWGDCLQKMSCLTYDEIKEYAGDKPVLSWHISELKIYDEPKEINEFYNLCDESLTDIESNKCKKCIYHRDKNEMSLTNDQNCVCNGAKHITRAPQSWCYVDELR